MARARHWLLVTATIGTIASGCSGLLGLDPLPGDDNDLTADSGPDAVVQDGRVPTSDTGSVDATREDVTPRLDAGADADAELEDSGLDANGSNDAGDSGKLDAGKDADADAGPPPRTRPYGEPPTFPNTECLKNYTTTYDFENGTDSHADAFSSGPSTITIEGMAARTGAKGLRILSPANVQTRGMTGIDFTSLRSGSGSNFIMCEADVNVFTAGSFAAYGILFGADYLSAIAQGMTLESGSPAGIGSVLGTLSEGKWMHLRYWVEDFDPDTGKTPVTFSWEGASGQGLGIAGRAFSAYPGAFIVGVDHTAVDSAAEVRVDNVMCCAKKK